MHPFSAPLNPSDGGVKQEPQMARNVQYSKQGSVLHTYQWKKSTGLKQIFFCIALDCPSTNED